MKTALTARNFASHLECDSCNSRFELSEKLLLCASCEGLLEVVYDLGGFDIARLTSPTNRARSIWRYRELLPVKKGAAIISLGEGLTPLIDPARYASSVGLERLYLKLEFLNPTGSFKDRGTTVSVSKLNELKVSAVLDDSSGNAGSSLAAYAAAAGIRCTLYVPSGASAQKVSQSEMYGARIVRVGGTRSNVERSARRAWKRSGVFYASHALSPYFIEGTKTFAIEIAEEWGWRVPDHVVFAVGGGSLLLGARKGFSELKEIGLIDRIPKLHCIQSEGCMPIVDAFRRGASAVRRVPERETIAAGIKISKPARGGQVLEALRTTRGSAVSVTDAEVLVQQELVSRTAGIFGEPTSCAALAGLVRLREKGVIAADDTVVVPITGFGLKDPRPPGRGTGIE